MKHKIFRNINLQLFAAGGDGAGGDSGTGGVGTTADNGGIATSAKGEKNPLANVKYGIQEDAQTADAHTETAAVDTEDRNAAFEKLIKGEYKDLYDAKVQDTIQKRLKSTKETVDRYNALTPTLEMLAKKYGVDANDITALNKAIEDDDSYYAEEALEKGITVEQLKQIRKIERENESLKKQMQEQSIRENADKIYASWLNQSESLKSIYPSFNLDSELQNPHFADLLRNNVDVRTAYEVIHKDDIIRGAMQFTAQKVEQKMANKIIANGARPTENGMGANASAVAKSDVSQLTKADRADIIRRVARGEKIKF